MSAAAPPPSHIRSNWDTRLQQHEKFTTCIRNNVREYGGDSACLKELLANADDAKATHWTVCHDRSRYPAEPDLLLNSGMEGMQGPALWVCNNAEFSDQDWQNYTGSVGDSAKANDSKTIGKFGKGALTAYSLTDVIQILSGDHLLILDPHGTHLHDHLPSVFGNVVNTGDEHFVDINAHSPDQLSPFLSFTTNCLSVPTLSAGRHYPGTLFRLALRTPAAAQRSEISKESLSPDQIAQALDDFVQAAPDLLLFTRHVKSISVWTKASQHSKCVLMHACSASMRKLNMSSPVANCELQQAAISIQNGQDQSGGTTKRVWLKTTHSVNGQCGDVAILMRDDALGPGQDFPNVAGKVYSTMALPLAPTSLPVHINGDFRLSSDRRTLWAGEGDRGQGAKNKTVLIDDIAPAYAAAITNACAMDTTGQAAADIYKKWPTSHSFQPRQLDDVTRATVEQLVTKHCKVLWVPAASGSSILSGPTGNGMWVAASQACLVQPTDQMASAVITNVGRRAGLYIPEDVPPHVFKALTEPALSVKLLRPDTLRRALLSAGNIVKPDEVSDVLSYVTSDKRFENLDGLHLILLHDGTVQQMKWDSTGGMKYFIFTDDTSQGIYDLMEGSKHQLVEGSPAWKKLSKFSVNGTPLLESKRLNVMVPTLADLGLSLPPSWQHAVVDLGSIRAIRCGRHPSPDWIERFWALIASTVEAVPETLHPFALVPITGNRLASIQHCTKHQALSQAHLEPLPSTAASTLASIGCVLITEARANRVSPIPGSADPLTTALLATSQYLRVPLPELLSQQRLGSTQFHMARQLLAEHVQSSATVWSIIRRCPIFEANTGQMVTLDVSAAYALLPCASWEEHIAQLNDLLPWTPIKYHTASAVQRQLVQHSCMHIPTQAAFLQSELLPAIYSARSSSTEPLLLKAIELCPERSGSLTHVFIDGYLHPSGKTVDSSSSLFKTLFSQPSAGDDYKLLPQLYTTPARLAVLKEHSLAHLNTSEPHFFIRCSQRFADMSSSLATRGGRRLSWDLVAMLYSNVSTYRSRTWPDWSSTRDKLAACPIFRTADLQSPYTSAQPDFVSLAGSADHDQYQLVSLALPTIDNSHGDTKALRSQLGLPEQPSLAHVVDHLLKLVATPGLGALLKLPGHDFLRKGIHQAYQFIIDSVKKSLTDLSYESRRLAQQAWVLVQDCKFVRPCELCFDLEEDTPEGYAVPSKLMSMINEEPIVKRWFIDTMKVTALHDGAPKVKQLHPNPVTATTSVAKYLEGDFNNTAAYPDAAISVDGRHIFVHKRVVAKACSVLARRWDPLWDSSSDNAIAMGTCESCSIQPSYDTALLFLEYFYSGGVRWPGEQAEVQTAAELLVMACVYDVQHLVCIAEMALQCLLDTDNCCSILAIADHHEAKQLRARCLHLIKQGHRLIKTSEQYRSLDKALQAEVELAVTHIV